MGPLQLQIRHLVRERHPMFARGLDEARAASPALVDDLFERSLGWMVGAYGKVALTSIVDGYATFTLEVNRAQAAYERRGRYEFSTFVEVNADVYQDDVYMRRYYWGVFAILFCWPHYVDLMDFYLNRFVRGLNARRIVEVAPGHGVWGLLALAENPGASLEGLDISPTSLEMATNVASAAGFNSRTSYRVSDAAVLTPGTDPYDAGVCCFLLEHLEQPDEFLRRFGQTIRPGGRAFVTLALTAAQRDHIFEFRKESEAILAAEAAGFTVIESRVAKPSRFASGGRFIPRVQAMILERR